MSITIQGVTKTFGKIRAVDDVSLKIEQGIFGLIGPNGAGKTTLVRMLCGLLKPDQGNMQIGSHDCWSDAFEIKKTVSFLHETNEYPTGVSARKFLVFIGRIRGMTRTAAEHQASELLTRLNLDYASDRWISGYSKGMKQLVGVASCFMGDPQLIVMDEPTANLDPTGRYLVLQLVREWHDDRNVTFFISSHILHELERVCTHAGFLFKGRLVAQGTPTEIFHNLPAGNVIIRTDKTNCVFERLKEQFEMVEILQHEGVVLVRNQRLEDVSAKLNQILEQCGGMLLEFRQQDGYLEQTFKDLARRFENETE